MASAPSSSSLKDVCPKNARRCSKSFGHRGPCNKDRQLHRFWERSLIDQRAADDL